MVINSINKINMQNLKDHTTKLVYSMVKQCKILVIYNCIVTVRLQ